MASYHLCMKVGSRGKGLSHASYIFREGRYSNSHVEEELEYKTSGNLPEWAKDEKDFWQSADKNERAGGRVYREIVVALPNELTKEQRIELIDKFIKEQLGDKFAYSVAIHSKAATLGEGQDNPHAHIMFSERKLDGIKRGREHFFKQANSKQPELGGNKKDREWQKRDKLINIREAWANLQNEILAEYGHETRVDHRSFEARRNEAIAKKDMRATVILNREPERHVGPVVAAMVKKEMRKIKNRTQEDIAKVREQFLSSHPNDFVRGNHIKRKIYALTVEIYDAKKLDKIYEDAQKLTGKELFEHLDKYIKEIHKQKTVLSLDEENLQRDVISKERAVLMAESIHTKGKTKELSAEARKLENECETYRKQSEIFAKTPKPGLIEFGYKKEYQAKQDRLASWNKDLSFRGKINNDETAKLRAYLEQPDIKLKVEIIAGGILEKNKVKVGKLEEVKRQIATLDDSYSKLMGLKWDAAKVRSQSIYIRGRITKDNILNQADQISKQVRHAVTGLTQELSTRGGITVRIRADDDTYKKMRREREDGR